MDDPFSQLPKAAVLVYAGVLTAAVSNKALASQTEAELVVREVSEDMPPVAPTCGPACHTPGYQIYQPPPEPEPDPVAPTCGPSCHDSNYQEQNYQKEAPPLIEKKQGRCAVAPEPEIDLALLGLGLSFGVGLSVLGRGSGARRRTRGEP